MMIVLEGNTTILSSLTPLILLIYFTLTSIVQGLRGHVTGHCQRYLEPRPNCACVSGGGGGKTKKFR